MRRRLDRDDANRRLPVLLRLPTLWVGAEGTQGRLLRFLLLRRCSLPTHSRGPSQRQLGGLLLGTLMSAKGGKRTLGSCRQRVDYLFINEVGALVSQTLEDAD